MILLERGSNSSIERGSQVLDLGRHLLPEAQELYYSIPLELREKHAQGHSKIIRMGGIRHFLKNPNYVESNLDHLDSGLHKLLEWYPIFHNVIDMSHVQELYLTHDDPELAIQKDIQPLNRTRREQKLKDLEPEFGERLYRRHVKDPALRDRLILNLLEYEEDDPSNLEVQMARFKDKADGTTEVADIVFDVDWHKNWGRDEEGKVINPEDQVEAERHLEIAEEIEQHLWRTVPRMIPSAINLLTHLPTEESREAFRGIFLAELKRLDDVGLHTLYKTYSKNG